MTKQPSKSVVRRLAIQKRGEASSGAVEAAKEIRNRVAFRAVSVQRNAEIIDRLAVTPAVAAYRESAETLAAEVKANSATLVRMGQELATVTAECDELKRQKAQHRENWLEVCVDNHRLTAERERLVEAARAAATSLSLAVDLNEELRGEGAFAENPPGWAKDPWNDNDACKCDYCGSWATVVRPGKTQCNYCGDNWLAAVLTELRTALAECAGKESGSGDS
jgi:hypothetical protein